MNFLASSLFLLLFLGICHAFTAPLLHTPQRASVDPRTTTLPLSAITKQQTYILDGAELSYYIKSLQEQQHSLNNNSNSDIELPNLAPRSPNKSNRIGSITFVTVTLDEDIKKNDSDGEEKEVWLKRGTEIIGVQVVPPSSINDNTSNSIDNGCDDIDMSTTRENVISINNDIQLYQDSIAILPTTTISSNKKKKDYADYISTAATALLLGSATTQHRHSDINNNNGNDRKDVKDENNNNDKRKKVVVIVGGGNYALYLATAYTTLGYKAHVVSARPSWSLPSPSDLGKQENGVVEIIPPSVGKLSLGFTSAIGEFDILIDTLGDELGIGRAMNIVKHHENEDMSSSSRFTQQLNDLHNCQTYISTITRSQQYVLKNGLLFARENVIRYQNEIESPSTSIIQSLPPPSNFGNIIQTLINENVIYKSNTNENGNNASKDRFVRGWSLSDLTELKTWPMDGAVRYGFPLVDINVSNLGQRHRIGRKKIKSNVNIREIQAETTKRAKNIALVVDKLNLNDEHSGEDDESTHIISESVSNSTTIKITNQRRHVTTSRQPSNNPYITSISSASELNQQIIESKRNCILYITASYCQKCKRMTPQLNRIARLSSEESLESSSEKKKVLFAHVDISNGPRGKQLGNILNVDKVPSVVVFQNGERVKITSGSDNNVGNKASSIIIERHNLNRLGEVANALENGDMNVNVHVLMTSLSEETIKK